MNTPTQTTEPIPVQKLIPWLADPEGTKGERSPFITDGMLMCAAATALLPEDKRPVATIVWPAARDAVYAIARGEDIDVVADTHGGLMPRPRKFVAGDRVVYIGGASTYLFSTGWSVVTDDEIHTVAGYLTEGSYAVTLVNGAGDAPDDSFLTLATAEDEARAFPGVAA